MLRLLTYKLAIFANVSLATTEALHYPDVLFLAPTQLDAPHVCVIALQMALLTEWFLGGPHS